MRLGNYKFNFIALSAFSLALFSLPSVAQTIECQIMKEQIIREVSSSQNMPTQQQQQQEALAVARMTPQEQIAYNSYRSGQQLGNVLGGILNSGPTLEQKIQIYKQKCE